jgi:hypothetical protein
VVAPPSLGALPVVPQTGTASSTGAVETGSAGSPTDPFDDVFLLSVLRDELGAEVVDLPLSQVHNVAVDQADGATGLDIDGAAGLETGRGSDDRDDDEQSFVVPAMLPVPIDLPLVKIVTSGEHEQPTTLIDDLPLRQPAKASAIALAPAQDVPATGEAVEDTTTFAAGEGVRIPVKPSAAADTSNWTAPPIVRLDVPPTTWRAEPAKSREMRELLSSQLGEGGAHVVVTHAGALPPSPSSVTPVLLVSSAAFHAASSATSPMPRTDRDSTVASDTADRIVQSIRLQWTRGGGEARITLEPSHLGELTVSLKVEQGVVAVRLMAETAVVREWLQTHQQTLRQGLAEHQLTLDKLEISGPANTEQSGDRDDRNSRDFRESRDSREKRRPRPDATFDFEA